MCDPLTIAGVGMTAASTIANMEAESQVGNARSGVMNAELFRQGNFDSQNDSHNATARGRYDDIRGKEGAREKEISDYYKENSGALPTSGVTAGAMPESSSNITVQEGKKQTEKVGAFNTQQNDASAKLRSFGDIMATASRGNAQDAANIGTVNSFKRGSSGVLPLELETANSAGNGMKMVGDILGGAGKVSTFAGLSGAGAAAPSSPAGAAMPHGATKISEGGNWFSRLFR